MSDVFISQEDVHVLAYLTGFSENSVAQALVRGKKRLQGIKKARGVQHLDADSR
ncbi:MAG TPA: hypothetical protein VJO16_08100 [Candidatus Acidoferrum sp.]|nr:hypothetical protein [Candidatus Acidoferrum sp.]